MALENDPAGFITLSTLIHPTNNGILFLTNPVHANFAQSVLSAVGNPNTTTHRLLSNHALREQQNIQHGDFLQFIEFHTITVPAKDVVLLGSTNVPALRSSLFASICNAFSVPEYYGYQFEALDFFLRDLSWLETTNLTKKTTRFENPSFSTINSSTNAIPPPPPTIFSGHVLIVSIATIGYGSPQSASALAELCISQLHFLWQMLSRVSEYWKLQNKVFHVFVSLDAPGTCCNGFSPARL